MTKEIRIIQDIDEINQELFAKLNNLMNSNVDDNILKTELCQLHYADLAHFVENIGGNDRERIISLLGNEFPSLTLVELDHELIKQTISSLASRIVRL